MLKAMFKKEYKPKYSVFILPAIAFIYLISPIDIIPDIIPVIGWMDDVAIVAFVVPFLMKEVEKFLLWKEGKNGNGLKTIDIEAL